MMRHADFLNQKSAKLSDRDYVANVSQRFAQSVSCESVYLRSGFHLFAATSSPPRTLCQKLTSLDLDPH